MSTSTQLYLNTRWELDDIKTVIERIQGEKVKVKSNHTIALGYFEFQVSGRFINVHSHADTPLGMATLLTIGADDEGKAIFKAIADCLGGIYIESDYKGKAELIMGKLSDEDGLSYSVKYAVIHDGINPDDLAGLIHSMDEWDSRCRNPHRSLTTEILSQLEGEHSQGGS